MMTTFYYFFLILYTYLFSLLFNIKLDFTNPFFYLLGVVSLLISFVLSIFTVLVFTDLLSRLRQHKGTQNRFNHYFSKSLMRLVCHLLRIKVITTGYENVPKDNKFVFMGNHQSNIDIMVYLPVFKDHPVNFIAKQSLFKAPFIGLWISSLGNIPIPKFADRAAAEAIIKGIKRYKEGNPMAIFPEGKRSFQNELIDFKPGAFKLAMKAKADILLGVLYDAHKVAKTKFYKTKKVYVHFLKVVPYEEYKEMKSIELSDHVRTLIQAQLDVFNNTGK